MAILELSATRPRTRIGFVDLDAPSLAQEALSDYVPYRFEQSHLQDTDRLAETEAVIFVQASNKPKTVLRQLQDYAPALLTRDCRIIVKPVEAIPGNNAPTFRQMIIEAINELELPTSGLSDKDTKPFGSWFPGISFERFTPCVHLADTSIGWADIATLIRSNPAGVPPNMNLKVKVVNANGRSVRLDREAQLLVRRAFWNCFSVKLIKLGNGLSGVSAYKGYAYLSQSAVGSSWPYQYFVKIGSRGKIAREFLAYRANALENVPYHLGPRLRFDRCALGHRKGILASDYVSGAETLKDCAIDGRAVSAIGSLFNNTLWPWRQGAVEQATPLLDLLSDSVPPKIPVHRKKAIKQFGGTKSVADLRSTFPLAPQGPVKVGVVHGDLHATNVLIRGNDAIIIDFEKVGLRYPLLYDFASLEGGLFIDGFIDYADSADTLLATLACLYQPTAFDSDPAPCHPADKAGWYFDCVRQIRMQAYQVQLEPRQYAWTLAIVLLKKACNKKNFKAASDKAERLSREDIRALAYVLAERILTSLANSVAP